MCTALDDALQMVLYVLLLYVWAKRETDPLLYIIIILSKSSQWAAAEHGVCSRPQDYENANNGKVIEDDYWRQHRPRRKIFRGRTLIVWAQ